MGMSRRIVIIGAGFSGTLTAIHALRTGTAHVTLIERASRFGPGLAYSTVNPAHLLNVPAGNMSALDDQPGHFLKFAQQKDAGIVGGTFVPRGWYGEYLERLLGEAAGPTLRRVQGEVVAVERRGGGFAVRVGGMDAHIEADAVVLALGNAEPPAIPGADGEVLSHPRYIASPWRPDALDAVLPDEPVFIVGSGLTMVDVVLALHARDHAGRIMAVSRHGLLPRPHRSPSKPPVHRDPPADLSTWDGSTRELVRIVRAAVRQSALRGTDWRDVVTSLRPVTHALWGAMPGHERERFLARVRSFWEVVRHRAAPEAAATVADLLASRRLSVRAGRVTGVSVAGKLLEVSFRPRGSELVQTHRVARVINCLGPDLDVGRTGSPLLKQMLAHGLISPDPHGLGLAISADDRSIGLNGVPVESLLVVGPMGKGRSWENTAVPELRRHAARVALAAMSPSTASGPSIVTSPGPGAATFGTA
jgi:uncharacterized NAD(P)/FAD-binding protein YdhS